MSGPRAVPGLTKRVKQRIYDHVFDNDGGEVGGVLVGSPVDDEAFAQVVGSIPALEAEGARASVTFTHEAWARVHEALERDFPDRQIVGWYHSHPGFGIFLSNHDLFIHQNFFSGTSQIAYVIDPHAGTEGVFGWADGQVELLEERATDRPGTRSREHPEPPGSRPQPPGAGPHFPIIGLMISGLIGFALGLLLWLAFFAGDPQPSAPAASTAAPSAAPPVSTQAPRVVEPEPGVSSDLDGGAP